MSQPDPEILQRIQIVQSRRRSRRYRRRLCGPIRRRARTTGSAADVTSAEQAEQRAPISCAAPGSRGNG